MSGRVGRKTVYIGTVVGVLALVAGFAMAAVFTSQTVTSNQNGFNASTGNTVWSGAAVTLGPGTSTNACDATPAANPVSSPASGSLSVTLGSSASKTFYYGMTGSCSSSDFAEEWSFTMSVSTAATDADTFTIFSTWTQVSTPASAVAADTITMIASGTGTSSVTLNLVVDIGSNVSPASISSLNVVVSGA